MNLFQRSLIGSVSILLLLFLVSCSTSDGSGTVPSSTGYSGDTPEFDFEMFSLDPDSLIARLAEVPDDPESGVRVALFEQYHEIHADGRVDRTFRWIYQITNESALAGWGGTSVDWSPWYQDEPELHVRVSNPDGTVRDMDESDGFEESPGGDDPLIYSNYKRLRIPFAGARVGSVVEEYVHISEHQPYFSGGYTTRVGFHRGLPLNISRVVVEHPSNMDVKTEIRGIDNLLTDRVEKGNNTIQIFEARGLEDYPEYESYLPYNLEHWPSIGISTASDWAEVNDVYSGMVEGALEGGNLDSIAAVLKDSDRTKTLENVVAYVRDNVRYTGLLLGDKSIRPTDVTEVLHRGFGDCKDMSVLVVGLLRALDIEADVALVRSGYDEDVSENMPGLGQFNHAIVAVSSDEGYLWIDPTALYNSYLIPPLSIQDRLALIISPETVNLVRTSSPDSRSNRILNTGVITLADDGSGVWEGSFEYDGAIADWYRGANASTVEDTARVYFEDWYDNIVMSGELTRYDRSDPTLVNEPFRVEWTWEDFGRSGTYDDVAVVSMMPQMFFLNIPDLFLDGSITERAHPFFATMPLTEEWDITIIPATGYRSSSIPDDMDLEIGGMHLQVRYTAEPDGSVRMKAFMDTGERTMDPGIFLEAVEIASELNAQDGAVCYFENEGARLINEGEFAEGLAVYREAYKADPASHASARRYANALLQAGMGQAARSLLEEALENDPDNSELHKAFGSLLTYDLVGRHASRGWDRDGAISEFRKALEADPENSSALYELAEILETGYSGEFMGTGADLEAALAAYRQLYDEFGSDDALWDAIYTAIYLGRIDTVRELASDLPESDDERYFLFLADVLETAPEGIPALARKMPTEYERQTFLQESEDILLELGEYERAAVVAREGARGTADVMNAESRAAFYESLARAKEEFEGTEVEELAYKLMTAILSFDEDGGAALEQIVSEDMYRISVEEDDETFGEVMGMVSDLTATTGLGPDIILDIIRSALTVESRGKQSIGYIADITMGIGEQETRLDFFVDQDVAGLRIIGGRDDSALLGRHILRCLDSGRDAAARNAIEYMWDDVSALDSALSERFNTVPEGEDIRDAAVILAAALGDTRALDDMEELLNESPDDVFLQFTLANGLIQAEEYDRAVDQARRVWQSDSENDQYTYTYLSALNGQENWTELDEVTRMMLEDGSSSLITVYQRASDAAMGLGDLDRAEELLLALADEFPGTVVGVYNTLAWIQLFREEMDGRAMEYIMKSLDAGGNYSGAVLHTAAAVLGRLDRAEDAMVMLQQSMTSTGVSEPDSHDWLVLGYIAQSYKLPDVAQDAFERVEYDSYPNSSYWLARREMEQD